MNNKKLIKRYILLHIFLGKWKLGSKLPSAQQLQIKLNVSLPTIKKELRTFITNNILITEKRKGYFVNPKLHNFVPLSIRKKYTLEYKGTCVTKQKHGSLIKKEYVSKETNSNVWVDSTIFSEVFNHSHYLNEKSFMYNLAFNGLIVTKILTKYKVKDVDGHKYLVENRQLFDMENILVVDENIYVPYEIWFGKEKWEF